MTCAEKIISEEFGELLLDYSIEEELGSVAGESRSMDGLDEACQVTVDQDISIVYFRRNADTAVDLSRYPYYSLPKCYGLMQTENVQQTGSAPQAEDRRQAGGMSRMEAGLADRSFDPLALASAGILQVQREPLSLTGRGVIIGLIDTGIRYTMDVFKNAAGGSRIHAIWDQTLTGTPPEGFFYGAAYDRTQINAALSSDTPRELVPSWDEDGHGTMLAGVAAGSILEGGSRYIGAAPDADIVVVKLRGAKQYLREHYILPEAAVAYAETDILLAVKYIESFAVALRRPVVICLGIGSSYGSHTGASVLDRYLNSIADRRSRAVVVCGGNEGAAAHHVQNLATVQAQTTELRVGDGERGFLLEVWAEGPSRYDMTIRSPGGEEITGISTRSRRSDQYRFIFEQTRIGVESIPLEEASGRSLLLLRFVDPTTGIWTLTIRTAAGIAGRRYHMWLPIAAFMESETFFLRPDPYVTLTEPSMAAGVITVNAYNEANDSFYERSGRGFTADRRIKPEFTAPGVDIPTPLGRQSGSSVAAAMAAGAVAQLLQWAVVEENYPLASGSELKYYLALGAEREGGIEYPSREWGLGRINVQRTFQELAGLFD